MVVKTIGYLKGTGFIKCKIKGDGEELVNYMNSIMEPIKDVWEKAVELEKEDDEDDE